MADIRKRVAEDVPGDFFVDSTCIDCDTCRQVAGETFAAGTATAYVWRQPLDLVERRKALQAVVCCPTGSIGCADRGEAKSVFSDFPQSIELPVYYCGFNSPKSYGGNSYFVQDPAGNWMIDAPKFLPTLVRRFESMGGVANIFLTHRDDVADADAYAKHFRSRRFIHRLELDSQPDAETVLDGFEPQVLTPGFLAIPTPGHTAGHCVLLAHDRFLFTGDHLDWDRSERRLSASRNYCWHSWTKQIASMRGLATHRFEWVLPGHGQRIWQPFDEMNRHLVALTERMSTE